jgi:hypothetical protein
MTVKIFLPENTFCLLKPGDHVEFDQPFLEKKEKKETEIFIAKELGIHPKKIFRFLKKFVGDVVEKDEVIAFKKSFFSEKKILSPFSGIIKEIDHNLGKLVICLDEKKKKIVSAYFQGEVIKVKEGFLELAVNKQQEYPVKNLEKSFGGPVFYLMEKDVGSLSNNVINKKIIIAEDITGLMQAKIEALGCLGLVIAHPPAEIPAIPSAILKNPKDFQKILADKFPYCFLDQLSGKIIFYE